MITKLKADTKIRGIENLAVLDFWAWAYSNILSNTNRGIFAEFLVGSALGILNEPRVEWNICDLVYRGKMIEVKSAAYLQAWNQNKPSRIVFDIKEKKSWDSKSNTYLISPCRSADCYVFCLFNEKDASRANVLDISQWEFYVTKTVELERNSKNRSSIGIKKLKLISHPIKYDNLKTTIDLLF